MCACPRRSPRNDRAHDRAGERLFASAQRLTRRSFVSACQRACAQARGVCSERGVDRKASDRVADRGLQFAGFKPRARVPKDERVGQRCGARPAEEGLAVLLVDFALQRDERVALCADAHRPLRRHTRDDARAHSAATQHAQSGISTRSATHTFGVHKQTLMRPGGRVPVVYTCRSAPAVSNLNRRLALLHSRERRL
eukprot:6185692-Pleurochrysis_carterae.AAC.3